MRTMANGTALELRRLSWLSASSLECASGMKVQETPNTIPCVGRYLTKPPERECPHIGLGKVGGASAVRTHFQGSRSVLLVIRLDIC